MSQRTRECARNVEWNNRNVQVDGFGLSRNFAFCCQRKLRFGNGMGKTGRSRCFVGRFAGAGAWIRFLGHPLPARAATRRTECCASLDYLRGRSIAVKRFWKAGRKVAYRICLSAWTYSHVDKIIYLLLCLREEALVGKWVKLLDTDGRAKGKRLLSGRSILYALHFVFKKMYEISSCSRSLPYPGDVMCSCLTKPN